MRFARCAPSCSTAPRPGASRSTHTSLAGRRWHFAWVNENARPFIVFDITDDSHFVDLPLGSHTIRVASPRALRAMKMARYARKDFADITVLVRTLNLTTAQDVVALTYDIFGEDSMAIPEGPDDLLMRAKDALRRATSSP